MTQKIFKKEIFKNGKKKILFKTLKYDSFKNFCGQPNTSVSKLFK